MKKAIKMIAILLIAFVGVNIIAKAADTADVATYFVGVASEFYGTPELVVRIDAQPKEGISVQAAALTIEFDKDKLEYLGTTPGDFDNGYPGNITIGERIIVDNGTPITGRHTVINLRFKVKEAFAVNQTATIKLKEAKFADDTKEYTGGTGSISIKRVVEPEFVPGDWDGNRTVDGVDVVNIFRCSLGWEDYVNAFNSKPENHRKAIDIVKDNPNAIEIDGRDVVKVLYISLGWE